MHGAKELIFKFKDHASAAFWSLSAAVFVFAVLLVLLGESAAVRWALAIMMLLVCIGILIWAQEPVRKICASLEQATGQAEAEGETRRQKILELEETCNRLEREKGNIQEECETKTRQHLDRVSEEQARVAAVLQQAEGSRLEKER